MVTALELARVAAIAADDKQAEDICLFNVSELSDVCDCILICSGSNSPKIRAIADEIEEKVRVNCSEKPLSIEGRQEMNWLLLDYGSVVIHIFDEETRDYYGLAKLWADAPRVKLDLEGEMPYFSA